MTDGTAGWFKDPSDPALARWHDGNDWTEHTLVIADQTPGVEPAPPVIESPDPAHAPRHTSATPVPAAAGGRLRGLPIWAKVGAPLAAILLVVFAVSIVSSSDDPDDRTETSDTVPVDLEDAVDAARQSGLPDAVTDARAADLMERICEAAERPSMVPALGRVLGALPVSSVGELRNAIDALGDGSRTLCAEALREAPDLIDDLQRLAAEAFTTTTTSPSLAPEGTDAGVAGVDGGVDGTDGGDGGSNGDSRTTTTTRRRGATGTTGGSTPRPTSPPATPAPTTATTLPSVLRGSRCSSAGATARNQITGGTITCGRSCGGSLQWGANCTQSTTPPTNAPGTTAPAATTTTSGE